MNYLLKEDLVNVIWGATFFGGGGGGSMKSGLDLLNKFESENPGKEIKLPLISVSEMKEGSYAAVTAGMGAPTALVGIDFTPYAINAYEALKVMAAKMDKPKKLEYSFAVEMGGFNTFVPMLISIVNDVPFVDTDGAGRAVPALQTLLLHINGMDTSPLAMADAKNNKLNIFLDDPRDAATAEQIGRHICMAFNMISGLSGWMISKEEAGKLPVGSITRAKEAGKVLREAVGKNPFDMLNAAGFPCVSAVPAVCKVVEAETLQKGGFDYGVVTFESELGNKLVIYFQNENLVLEVDGKPIMTVPDIITVVDAKTGVPLTNADTKKGMDVYVGIMKVDDSWWQNPEMPKIWQSFFNNVGYEGSIIKYEDTLKLMKK